MTSLSNLKIGTRLALGFAAVLLFLAFIMGLGLNSMSSIQAYLNGIVSSNNVKVATANKMLDSIRDMTNLATHLVLLTDEAAMREEMKKITAARERYTEARTQLGKLIVSSDGKALLAKVEDTLSVAAPMNARLLELALQNKTDEATELLMNKFTPSVQAILAALNDLVQHETRLSEKARDHANAEYSQARNLMVGLGVVALLMGAAIAWFTTGSITRPIAAAVKVAETVAAGDISSRIEVRSRDETGQLMHALKEMNDSLVKIVGEVRTGTDTIATASSQIATGNQDLSSRTEEQASSLEQTAAS
ncbi:MCP four helix bundle domain-containing protein, partial [Variovorax sp. J22R115]|uniref:MCP four helix bundle domain-containing protein n=1 Tax=Variovorax sp. J22R115 TaxID=3053509 RepID=UPI002574AE1B